MTAFDYAVIGIVALSLLLGWWRGVVSEILALAAWVVAFVVARVGAAQVVAFVPERIREPDLRLIVAWIAVFVAVLLLFALARALLRLLLKAIGLGWLDRLLGAGFGIARGLLVVLTLVLLAGLTPLPRQDWWRQAQLAPPLETAVLAAKPWMPPPLARRIGYRQG